MPHRSAATTPLFALLLLGFAVGASFGATSYYVAQSAPGAADQNPGTEKAPFKTIGAAMKLVKPGDTVLVGRGTYREEVVWKGEDWKNPQVRTTLAASPGTRPVIKGSDVVTAAWTKAEVKLTTAPAAAPPSAGTAPIYSCPWERYSQMVFVDEQPLQQIGLRGSPARAKGNNGFQFTKQWDGKSVADLRPGSFYMDGEAKRLYVWLADGSNPARHTIEASVRATGVSVNGTWTVRGLDVRQFQDHFWPYEQAVAINGNQSIAEDCHITHNELLGLIMSGEDCIVRNNEIAYNGLMGLTSNVGYRTLVEGNEFHHDCWRGDVVCLTLGNKMVYWRDARFLRNRWHDRCVTLKLPVDFHRVIQSGRTSDAYG